MQHARGTLIGKLGRRLSYGQWYPEGTPRAMAAVVHGYAEHIGRYQHVIDALVARGYVVFAIDHRGHGESEGERAWVERFDYFIDDLHLMVLEMRDAHPELPLFVAGHSMGGLIAARYALRYQKDLAGLVLSGAALRIGDDVSPALKKAGAFLSKVAPKVAVVDGVAGKLSRDPEVQQRVDNDPLCYHGKTKARLAQEMYVASQETSMRGHLLTVPVLIMHGTADAITHPEGSKTFYERARSQDKTLKLWEGFWHEIFNEPEKEEVIGFMADWMDERVMNGREIKEMKEIREITDTAGS